MVAAVDPLALAHRVSMARASAALQCPRPESNQRTRFRKPMLYPLSYGGGMQRLAGSSPHQSCAVYRAAPRHPELGQAGLNARPIRTGEANTT
jgi:hypothetical protein